MSRIRASVHLLRQRTLALIAILALIGAGAVVAVAVPAQAATGTSYYVDCAAATNGSGTQSSPWNSTTAVNGTTFSAGSSILFDRGTTCAGSLAPQGSGTSGAPITVGAYGTGTLPVIAAGSTATAAFELNDQSYWTIRDLQITGGVDYGVYVTGNTANAALTDIVLTNLDVSGATGTTTVRGDSGEVYVYPRGSQETISNVTVNGVTAHDSHVGEGIFVAGAFGAFPPGTVVPSPGNTAIGSNITIENSSASSVAGDGILLTMATNGVIEHSVARNSGACSACGSTPSGLWEWYCQHCTLQYNESYDNHTWGSSDGGAFDIDNYNAYNTLQYNYGHDNDGYCLAVFGDHYTPVNDVFRYNVCSNNEQKPSAGSYEMSIWPTSSTNLQIYNNTFYFNPANGHPFMNLTSGGASGLFKNNIVYSTSANLFDNAASSMQFDNNIYYVSTGATPTFTYAGTNYSGLPAYQAASGQDTHSLTGNPQLNTPAYHAVGASSSADTLQAGSPALGAGVNICQGITGCSMGSQDYFGDPVTTAGTHTIGAQDIPSPLTQVANTGFESGSCSGWNCYGGATAVSGNAHNGSHAVQLPGSASSGTEQVVTGLSPNTQYQLEGFAKSGVAGQCVYLGAKSFGGTETRTCLASTAYTGGSVTFTTGANNTSADIYLWNPSTNTATGYGDDVTLAAVPAQQSYGALMNTASSSCLDIAGGSRNAGGAVEIWSCNGGANQMLTRASNHELQVYPGSSTLCLGPSGSATSAGTAVVTATCTGTATQLWSVSNGGEVTNTGSGLCLGPAGGATADGTALQLQACTDASSQHWNEQ